MKNGFYIMLNMRSANGFENFGQFFIGPEERFAKKLYACLKGHRRVCDQDALHMDLAEFRKDLPIDFSIMTCTLEEMAQNCRIISKELFRINNLDKEE